MYVLNKGHLSLTTSYYENVINLRSVEFSDKYTQNGFEKL